MTSSPSRTLSGSRALVSGASRGIGQGIAVELARAGADVVINHYPSAEDATEAERVVAECQSHGVRAHQVAADVACKDDVERLIDRSIDLVGGIDIVVSNAAYSDRRLMLEADLDEFRKTIDVCMWGAFYLLRAAAERMIRIGASGSIVVISSPHAHKPIPGAMAYNMAKAANDQMAKTAACELAAHNIRVNLIHPGWTNTPGERKFFTEQTLASEGAKLPLGRLGEPSEIGRGVVFLSAPESGYITGTTLTIDGGIQLPWREMFRIEEAGKATP